MPRIRLFSAAALLVIAASCSDPGAPDVHQPEAYVGAWRSTTAPYEHLRLTVGTLPAETSALHVRLTFSGVWWEGPGRIERDSLVMDASSSSQSGAAVIARAQPGGDLSVRVLSSAAAPLTLTFVREE